MLNYIENKSRALILFIFRSQRSVRKTENARYEDPYADPEIKKMSLNQLADLPSIPDRFQNYGVLKQQKHRGSNPLCFH